MRALSLAASLAACAQLASPVAAQIASPPRVVGRLVGPGATPAPPGLRLYGTDLGWTFEHQGQLIMLFGDTWRHARSLCDGEPRNDDTQATLPLAAPAGVPPLTFLTKSDVPGEFAPILLSRGAASLSLAYGQVPLTGFSDGADAIAVFGRAEYVRCWRRTPRAQPSCRPHKHLRCTQEVGECVPRLLVVPTLCDLASGAGCILNIIDAYTRPDPASGGLELFWNVSTWNPYGVALVRSVIRPGESRSAGPATGSRRNPAVRWCRATG